MRIIAIGRLKPGPESALIERYRARIRPRLDITELAEARGSPAEIRRKEGDAILAALDGRAKLLALHPGGEILSSEGFASLLTRLLDSGSDIAFAIGGAEGLDAAVLSRAAARISFGPMIWPHMLARVMLSEQIFRARSIAAGHPYHRA